MESVGKDTNFYIQNHARRTFTTRPKIGGLRLKGALL